MAVTARIACAAAKQALLQSRCVLSVQPHRNRHKAVFRGKWPEEAKTFQQRLDGTSTNQFCVLMCCLQLYAAMVQT